MSKDQIKSEINKVLDHLSDSALEEVFNLLKKLDAKGGIVESDSFRRILKEDDRLLQRLAK